MSRIFYPTSEKLAFLLTSIHNREVALPDFQRDFVWDPAATEELVESICQNFPAGSLLRIKNGSGFYFAPREFAGAPELNGNAPSYLILDGQQRLTSLYQALYGHGDHRYYLDLQGLLEGKDLEDCVFYLRKKDGKKRYGTLEQQADTLVFPLEQLFGGSGFEEWLDQVLEIRPESGDEGKSLKQNLRDLRKAWLKPVEEYEFPMVTLAENTKPAAVCTIFETLNRTGVRLSVFDLLAARFWPEGVKLRDLWDQVLNEHKIIAEFDVDPYYLLQAISIFTAEQAPSCKRGDVLELKVDQIRKGWSPVVQALSEGLHLLRNDCGVVLPRWLPYNTIVIPIAAALAATARAKGPEVGAIKNKLKRWFWCSVFGQAYERAPNSQAVKDYVELRRWFVGGELPETIQKFSFDPTMLRETRPRQRAVYRGVVALILRNGARDFHSGDRMTATMISEQRIDDHHVFPQAFLAKAKPGIEVVLRDCVLNRTLIDRETNIRISSSAPSAYLTKISKEMGEEELARLLKSHLLPDGPDSPLWSNDFETFLNMRQELLMTQIREVTA
jgi:hypothetical protein